MRKYLVLSLVALSILLLLLSCAKPKRTNPLDPGNPNAPGALTGRVSDSRGRAVAGAKVITAPATSEATTDTLGNYLIQNIPPASYQVIAWATMYYDTARNSVTIKPALTETLDMPLGPVNRGAIFGRVMATDTLPVPGAIVVTRPPSESVATDNNGYYRIPNVIPGVYQVLVKNTKDLKPQPPDSAYSSSGVDTVLVQSGKDVVADFILYRVVWWTFDNDPLDTTARGWNVGRRRWKVTDINPPGGRTYRGEDTTGVGGFGAWTIPQDPRHNFANFTLFLNLTVLSSSPRNGSSEIFFRWQDNNHHYRVSLTDSLTPAKITLYKVQGGAPSRLTSGNLPFNRDQGLSVRITCLSDTIEVWADNMPRISWRDPAFTQGRIGLGVSGSGMAFFDDVMVIH